jgi:hypothetical protein
MHCTLLVPELPFGNPGFLEHLAQRRYPSLELLLARGRRAQIAVESREQWLLESFSVDKQEDWPSAPFALLGEGGAPGDGFWVHADPVHLVADQDQVLVAHGALLEVGDAEAHQLAQSVSAHFGQALQLHVARPRRWYARLASPPPGPTVPLRRATGQAMPSSGISIHWHALMNEIQMALHEHPVNIGREARGEPAVNGLWLWGGGHLGAAKARHVREVASADPLATGLARAAGIPGGPLPGSAEAWLARSSPDGARVLVLGEPGKRDYDEPEALEGLEQQWAAPLLKALRSDRIGMVTVRFETRDGLISAETTRGDLRRLWRVRRTIDYYLTP